MTSITEGTATSQATVQAPEPKQPKATKKANKRAQAPAVASEKPKSGKKTTAAKKGTKAQKAAKATKAAKAGKPPESKGKREGSKTAIVLELIRREGGATLAEIMEATGWQKHSVRGFISGTVGKKMDLPVVSSKREDGERVYSLAK